MYVVARRSSGVNVIAIWDTNLDDSKLAMENGQAWIGRSGFLYTQPDLDVFGISTAVQSTTLNQRVSFGNANPVTVIPGTTTLMGTANFIVGSVNGNFNLNGQVAEIIFYGDDHTGATGARQKIETYLSVKYGISKAGDYISSAGTVIWDATVNSAYDQDVFGIGMDNGSGLVQIESNSIGTGSGDGTGQNAKGNIVLRSGLTSLTNGDFLIIGHDKGPLTFNNPNVPASIPNPGPFLRTGRVWKVSRSVGSSFYSSDLIFDFAGLGVGAINATNFKLLVNQVGTPDFTTASVIDPVATTATTATFSVNPFTLPDNSTFRFSATSQVLPLNLISFSGSHSFAGNLLKWQTLMKKIQAVLKLNTRWMGGVLVQ